LSAAGYRLGLLSNICELHWNYVSDGRFGLLRETFETVALSYQLKAMKPDAKIYLKAAELAGVAPQEIFYVDDIAGHVEGARAVGVDAVQYTTTPALVTELRRRGLEFNY
jgi:FMN phosphatase YigB (HAD superfamily)